MLASVLYLDRKCCSLSVLVQTSESTPRGSNVGYPHMTSAERAARHPPLVVDGYRSQYRYRIESRPATIDAPNVTRIRKGNVGIARDCGV